MNLDQDPETNHLGFIKYIDDYDKQRDYIHLIFRILTVEAKDDTDGWRASWPFPPNNHTRPWIPAKTGYLNKLETENIISRNKRSRSTSVYELIVDVEDITLELTEYSDFFDKENPLRDLEF